MWTDESIVQKKRAGGRDGEERRDELLDVGPKNWISTTCDGNDMVSSTPRIPDNLDWFPMTERRMDASGFNQDAGWMAWRSA